MILHGIEYQRPTSLNMRIMADHVTYSFLAFMKSIFHFCLGCYCGGYSQNGRSNLSSTAFFKYPSCLYWVVDFLYPPLQRSWKGGILVSPCLSVRLSVCGQNRVRSVSSIIPPASTKLKGGYTGITLSVCPSVDRIVSALYLQQYSSDPFHICTSYQATSEGVSLVMPISKFKNLKFWRIFKICNFDFVFFWLGIQYDPTVWVIMRRRGVSSEHRCSSCSSYASM